MRKVLTSVPASQLVFDFARVRRGTEFAMPRWYRAGRRAPGWYRKGRRAKFIGWTWTGEPFPMRRGTEFAMLRPDKHEPGTSRAVYRPRTIERDV